MLMSSLPLADISDAKETTGSAQSHDGGPATVLVCLPSVPADALFTVLDNLVAALPGQNLLVASPDASADTVDAGGPVRMISFRPQSPHSGWILTAADYLAAANLAREQNVSTTLLLGVEAASLSSDSLRALSAEITEGGADLVLPRYRIGPHEGLVSAALLYPLSRSLFGVEARMPLPLDAAFSARMASRLSTAARRPGSTPGIDPLFWPAAEAAIASLTVREVPVGERVLPQPDAADLNSLLAHVAGSLFADIETKAAFWQRARSAPPVGASMGSLTQNTITDEEDLAEIRSMAEGFRNAYANLQEIWSLVLPPQSLLALKKLSLSSPETFSMPANLWARTVYDFVLAFRLRTINRGHLLGALTPLYLAWVASHLRIADSDPGLAEQHIEETAAAFVAEKPYVLARWRWPDRFNP